MTRSSCKARGRGRGRGKAEEEEEWEEDDSQGGQRRACCEVPPPVPLQLAPTFDHTPFIHSGYRVNYTLTQCLLSVFTLHNELGNIWTHLLGFVAILVGSVWMIYQDCFATATTMEKAAIASFLGGALMCTMCSTVYHVFKSHSAYTCDKVLALDLVGIAALIGGSFFPGVWFGFYCSPVARAIHLFLSCLVFLIGVTLAATAHISSARIRTYGFASLVAIGLVPAAHWTLTSSESFRLLLLPGLVKMFLFYGLGFFFFVTRLPERAFPGLFDVWLHSHQLWHLCILAAVHTWFWQIVRYKELLQQSSCLDHEHTYTSQTS